MKKPSNSTISTFLAITALMAVASTVVADEKGSGEYAQERRAMMKEQRQERRELRQEARAQKMLQRVDTNQDGVVDLNEYLEHAQTRFGKMDLDANGVVTPEEAKESMAQMRREFKEKRKQAMKERAGE